MPPIIREKPRNPTVLSTESQELYDELAAAYNARFQPANQVEADLVDRLILCQWRICRAITLETAAIDHTMRVNDHRFEGDFGRIDPVSRTVLAIHTLNYVPTSLAALHREEGSYARQYPTVLKNLLMVQADRTARA